MEGLGRYVREYPPDLIVVHGDRIEALAGAIVGALNNILVAHIEGGEVSGTVDDLIRHAVSKLAHLHFVANTEAKSRLLQMGEERSTVFVIGSPDIDIMFSESLPSIEEAKQRYDIEFDEYAVFTYHPVTTEVRDLRQRIQAVVAALRASGWNYVVIYPNNDMGAEIILEHIEPLSDDPHFRVFPSIRFEHFLTLLRNAKAIVGNSSAGIREAPAYCVPAVNIGTRQMNRFQHSSIVTVGDDTQEILNALNDLPQIQVPSHHFGTGNSSELFLQCFRDPAFWQTPCQKQFQDVLLA
jgi:UDP-N-acetylglucosamine 2-epimerase (hydrolysing)